MLLMQRLLVLAALTSSTCCCTAWSPTPQQQASVAEIIKSKYDPIENTEIINTAKSDIYRARSKHFQTGEPEGKEVVIKLSRNHVGMRREAENYDFLMSTLFVEKLEFYQATHDDDPSAIVMECGETDLTKYIYLNRPLNPNDVREKAKAIVDVIAALHSRNVVWCEIKTCNFVLVPGGELKGIDIESATYVGTFNIMHTASGTPPEFAIEHLCGRNAPMDLSFDIWSLGMVFYKLACGEHYFDQRYRQDDYLMIFTYLRRKKKLNFAKLDAHYVDPRLKDLVVTCLDFDPKKRPTIQEIQQHPYFTER